MIVKTIEVHVTPQDIKQGVRRICSYCPVAIAINRHFIRASRIEVGWFCGRAYFSDDKSIAFNYSSTKVGVWIRDFDNGKSVEPFTFKLEIKEND